MIKDIKLLAFFNFFTDLKFHSAILILYFAKVTDSYLLAMSLFSVAMVSAALFEVPTGIFSDLIGRKRTIMMGAIAALTSAIFYAIGFNYWILFIGAVFEGLSRAWYSGNNDAFLYDTLLERNKQQDYGEYLGKVSSMFQAALSIGALVGGVIATFSFGLVMWLSVIPQGICVLISTLMSEPKKHSQKSANIFSHLHLSALHLWKNKKLRLLSLSSILGFGISEASFDFRSAFVATLWPIWAIGFSKVLPYVGGTIGYWFSGRIVKKFGAYFIVLASSIYSRTINIFSTLFPTVLSPILMSSTSLLYGISGVASNKLRQDEYTHEQRATIDSINSLLGKLFFGVAALGIGFLGDNFGPAIALLVGQIILIPTVFINWFLYNKHKHAN